MAEFGADVAAAGEEGHVEEPGGGEEEVGVFGVVVVMCVVNSVSFGGKVSFLFS